LKILVLNSGSSSLKCQLFELDGGHRVLAKATVERVGSDAAALTYREGDSQPFTETLDCPTHLVGIRRVLALLGELARVDAVGHRVVHAGEAFTGSVPVCDAVLAALEACCDLAPLHNPPNIAGIRACLEALPGVPQVCVFDNALHLSLPPEAYLYALPPRFYHEHRVRHYGFHGVAFRSMAEQVELVLGRPAAELRLVSLMLGSGCTANALNHGRSVAISTGFTPLEGLVQSTRCGDLDAGAVLALLRAGQSAAQLNDLFNRQSGLKGLSGVGPDMRDIEAADTPQARLALDIFVHRLIKYVGSYAADMDGLDVLAFGGGIGQNAAACRAAVCDPLAHLGIVLDAERNQATCRGRFGVISADEAPVKVVVVNVDEELVIARDTQAVVAAAP
jgi:acetate kinase